MSRYFRAHLPMALVYALLIFALRSSWWQFDVLHILSWVWWVVGVIVGVLILFLDRIAYIYSYPTEQLSQQFLWYVGQKKYVSALSLLDTRRLEQEKLVFRSALFMVIWIPLSFFALTSTAALFGKGVVMGLMLHDLVDAWQLQRRDASRLNVRLFSMIRGTITPDEQLLFLWVMSFVFVLFSFWIS